MVNLPELMTIQQVADYLQVSVSTVRRMLTDGRLRGVNLGNAWRIPKESVAELIASGTKGGHCND